MHSLRAVRLAFAYADAAPILSDVDLHLSAGFTGVVGPNGAGKSTLIALLTGGLEPTSGRVLLEPAEAVAVVCPQRVDGCSSDIEALADRDDRRAQRLRAELELDTSRLGRFATLSPGERKRWQIAAALARDPDVLALDEPTNHVDAEARALLLAALCRYRGIGLLVSHDRELLEALTGSTVRVHAGRAIAYAGAYGAARATWLAEEAHQRKVRQSARDEVDRLGRSLHEARSEHAAADRSRSTRRRMKGPADHDARGALAKGRAARGEKRTGRDVTIARRTLERAEAELSPFEVDRSLGRSVFVDHARAPMSTLLRLQRGAITRGRRALIHEVGLCLGREDRLAVTGPNGAGKTTLIEAIVDAVGFDRERLLFLPQELARAEEAQLQGRLCALSPADRGRALSLVAALGVDPHRLLASRSPSPGEARKLALALGLAKNAWLVVLDEPTNHLDLPSIERLEAALAAYPGALVIATHDLRFAEACRTRRLCIQDRRLVDADRATGVRAFATG